MLVLSAIFLAAGLYQFILPPQYRSTARILAQSEPFDTIESMSRSVPDAGFGGGHWVPTEFERIQSKVVLFQVISNLGLNLKWGEKFREGELRTDLTYQLLKKQLEVRQAPNSPVIEIRVMSNDPTEAASIANGIGQVYLSQREYRRNERGKNAEPQTAPDGFEYLIIKDSIPSVIDAAEVNLRPVKPDPVMKTVLPVAGVLLVIAGFALFTVGARPPESSAAKPPHFPTGSVEG